MRKKKWKINVDKLKICYLQPQHLWDYLQNFNTNDFINYDCFSLQIIDDGRGKDETNDKPRTKIKANVILDDGVLLGKFEFNNSAKYNGKCFFEFDNKALYTVANIYNGEKYNHLTTIDYIEQQLHLEKNNITTVEIAMDMNFNIVKVVQELVKNYKEYTMYLNGNIINDESRKIENYGEYFSRSRKKRSLYPTLYLNQAKENSPSIKMYNKQVEINEESGKEYIKEWNNMHGTMYRVEITVKNEDFKKFLEVAGNEIDLWGEIDGSCVHLSTEQYKHLLFIYITERMLYFKRKSGNKEYITLNDIITEQGKSI